ncbi:MAG: hypothetical protein ABIJ08_00380 [Nanoarchaeota archaeon]
MRYAAPEDVGLTGAKFKLEQGNIRELYTHLSDLLTIFYARQAIDFHAASTPDFGKMERGKYNLNSHNITKPRKNSEPQRLGFIGNGYFVARPHPKARSGVDYRVSSTFAFEHFDPTYQALTLFFNTTRYDILQDEASHKLIRHIERQHFAKIELKELEDLLTKVKNQSLTIDDIWGSNTGKHH